MPYHTIPHPFLCHTSSRTNPVLIATVCWFMMIPKILWWFYWSCSNFQWFDPFWWFPNTLQMAMIVACVAPAKLRQKSSRDQHSQTESKLKWGVPKRVPRHLMFFFSPFIASLGYPVILPPSGTPSSLGQRTELLGEAMLHRTGAGRSEAKRSEVGGGRWPLDSYTVPSSIMYVCMYVCNVM